MLVFLVPAYFGAQSPLFGSLRLLSQLCLVLSRYPAFF